MYEVDLGLQKSERESFDEMFEEYYEFRGWNEDGAPTPSTLSRFYPTCYESSKPAKGSCLPFATKTRTRRNHSLDPLLVHPELSIIQIYLVQHAPIIS
ncbi:aldehyde ferredoxin oxidoreductase C-terminal domain-containing protein [Halalkalicoccus tibetensis]|uniref:Aldehyde ferredoxin oxidoreductase C-terminal domain-containing protein n=1 Tax=Halalkalicoccus tibetensis TaxID=175632 RepID=A0ABD5VAJ5_9EURY